MKKAMILRARPSSAADRARAGLLGASLGLALAAPAHAQLVTTLIDRDGVSFSCVTVGPLAPVAQEYCVRRTLKQGWVLKSELGWSGLSIDDGGAVAAVIAGSPGDVAGVRVGDRLVSVDGRPVRPFPSQTVQRLIFGAKGETVKLGLLREGQAIERSFERASAPEPAGAPRSPNLLVGIHPLMNWRGDFVPCMGAGPLGPAAVAVCTSKMQHEGFVRTSTLGDTGIAFDSARTDAAVISTVRASSPASQADVRAGDVVTVVDGGPMVVNTRLEADALLFGKVEDSRLLVLDRGGRTVQADVRLAARR